VFYIQSEFWSTLMGFLNEYVGVNGDWHMAYHEML